MQMRNDAMRISLSSRFIDPCRKKRDKKETRKIKKRLGKSAPRDSFTFKWAVTNEQLIRNYQPIKVAFDGPGEL